MYSTLNVAPEYRQKARILAAQEGVSIKALVERIIENYAMNISQEATYYERSTNARPESDDRCHA